LRDTPMTVCWQLSSAPRGRSEPAASLPRRVFSLAFRSRRSRPLASLTSLRRPREGESLVYRAKCPSPRPRPRGGREGDSGTSLGWPRVPSLPALSRAAGEGRLRTSLALAASVLTPPSPARRERETPGQASVGRKCPHPALSRAAERRLRDKPRLAASALTPALSRAAGEGDPGQARLAARCPHLGPPPARGEGTPDKLRLAAMPSPHALSRAAGEENSGTSLGWPQVPSPRPSPARRERELRDKPRLAASASPRPSPARGGDPQRAGLHNSRLLRA
jgi:hypothetical protein